MSRVALAKPGEDPIDVYGEAPMPKTRLASLVGPVIVVALLIFIGARVLPQMLSHPEPTVPAAVILPSATITPTISATPRPTLTLPPTYTGTPPPTITPTFTATATLVPSWTPTGTRQPWIMGTVANARQLNVRAGPGISYPRLSVLDRGDQVRLIGREPGGRWGKIDSPVSGWVHLSYILPESPDDLVWLQTITDPPYVN